MSLSRGAAAHLLTAFLAAAAGGPAVAHAQVLQIEDDGRVHEIVSGPVQRQRPLPSGALDVYMRGAAERFEISARLIDAVAFVESRRRQSAVSAKGAVGVMQLLPATAAEMGFKVGDAGENIAGGAAYIKLLLRRYQGDIPLALAAYNAGPAAVSRYGSVPPYPETRAFVAAVLDRLSSEGQPR